MSHPIRPPLVLASTFTFDTAAEMDRAVSHRDAPLYTRWDNPTVAAVEARIARLEGAEAALLVSSGMAAVYLAWLSAPGPGDLHLQSPVYGGTDELANTLTSLPGGRPTRRHSLEALHTLAPLGAGELVHIEVPTNPLCRLLDPAAVRARIGPEAFLVADATFATPLLLRPLSRGADLSVHSATKYLGGHHDLIAGVLSGSAEVIARAWRWRKILGPCLDPAAAERLDRGLDTLEVRVDRASATATTLAARLESLPGVQRVWHPSLSSHPDHHLAAQLFGDPSRAGGMMSFDVGDGTRAAALMDHLRLIRVGASLGGTHSLITRPVSVTHANVPAAVRDQGGIGPGLLRLSVGLEPADLLFADLAQALSASSPIPGGAPERHPG